MSFPSRHVCCRNIRARPRVLSSSAALPRWQSLGHRACVHRGTGAGRHPHAHRDRQPEHDGLPAQRQLVGGELLKLQAEVAKLPPDRRVAVILDSPGGLVAEGLKLGQFFHEAKIATFVFAGGIGCHSACSLAFLGGRDAATGKRLRVMMSGAQLGFHQFGAKFDPAKTYNRRT